MTYIAQKIEDGFQDKQHTLTVWIDMETAYDRVGKDGLRHTIITHNNDTCIETIGNLSFTTPSMDLRVLKASPWSEERLVYE